MNKSYNKMLKNIQDGKYQSFPTSKKVLKELESELKNVFQSDLLNTYGLVNSSGALKVFNVAWSTNMKHPNYTEILKDFEKFVILIK